MSAQLDENAGVRLAIEGCGHGTLHSIYSSVAEACKRKGWPGVDLLIIGGDFQAVRNAYDLNCVSMPAKYRSMCDFHEYYSGQRTAPYLTIFVGGNHEASNYLFELYYGGWVAPNIYYMGASNVLRLGPLRIAGLSGIWKGYNYRKPHHERLPYNESDMRSIYHVRELDVRKLLQVRSQIDIGVSHDWPKGVEWKGDWKQLFRFKKHLEEDAKSGQLGSVAAKYVLDWLRPRWWFSAHLHCKYTAVVDHTQIDDPKYAPSSGDSELIQPKNDDEIDLDGDMDPMQTPSGEVAPHNSDEIDLGLDVDSESATIAAHADGDRHTDTEGCSLDLTHETPAAVTESGNETPSGAESATELRLDEARAALPESFRPRPPPEPAKHPPSISNKTTHFLALDKCLPGKHFLQLTGVPTQDELDVVRPLRLQYDREWLAITRTFALDEPLALGDSDTVVPKAMDPSQYAEVIEERRIWVDGNIKDPDLVIPEDFAITAPVYDSGNWNLPQYSQVREYPNLQTARFCKMLQIPNPFDVSEEELDRRLVRGPRSDPDAERFNGRGRGRGRGSHRGRGRSHGRGHFRGR